MPYHHFTRLCSCEVKKSQQSGGGDEIVVSGRNNYITSTATHIPHLHKHLCKALRQFYDQPIHQADTDIKECRLCRMNVSFSIYGTDPFGGDNGSVDDRNLRRALPSKS